MDTATKTEGRALPWNKGKLLGQKSPLKLKEIWGHPDSTATDSSDPANSRYSTSPSTARNAKLSIWCKHQEESEKGVNRRVRIQSPGQHW
jgi:hypothetical protein